MANSMIKTFGYLDADTKVSYDRSTFVRMHIFWRYVGLYFKWKGKNGWITLWHWYG